MRATKVIGSFFIAAFVICVLPSSRGADDPWRKLKDTMISMNKLNTALQSYQTDYGSYPVSDSLEKYAKVLAPDYIDKFPFNDGWGHRFILKTTKESYTLISYGADGLADADKSLIWKDMNSDIIYKDGETIKCPDRFSRSNGRKPDSLR